MANIVIGYQNYVCDPPLTTTVTITASTEHASHDADNLALTHPSKYHGFTSGSGMYQAFSFSGSVPTFPSLVCPLYLTNLAPCRSLVSANALPNTSAGWTETNAALTAIYVATSPVGRATGFGLVETTGGAAEHYAEGPTASFPGSTPNSLSVSARVYVRQSVGTRNSRIRLGDGTDYVTLDLTTNGQAPAYYANAANGSATLDSYSVGSADANGWVKVEMVMTYPSGKSSIDFRLQSLDSSYATSYAGNTGDGSRWVAPQMIVGASLPKQDMVDLQNAGAHGPTYDAQIDDSGSSFASLVYEGDPTELAPNPMFADSAGWGHGRPLLIDQSDVSGGRRAFRVRYANYTYMDVSNVYIGPYWQPTVNLANDWRIRPAAGSPAVGTAWGGQEYRSQNSEPRELVFRLGYETPEDALGEAHTMGVKVGQHSPILVIVNPDEVDHPQALTFYGVVTGLEIGHIGWFSDRGDGTAGSRYEISMTVRELLP